MSEISAGLKKTIKEIKRLADGDQLIACKELLQKKIFPYDNPKPEVNESVIQELLPTIIKFMESNDHVLQTAGADFIHGGLKSLKKLCDRLLVVKKDKKHYVFTNTKKHYVSLKERKIVKLLALRLVKYVTSYGEAEVDLVINDNFISLILQQIKGGMTPEIKIESIKVIENVISNKHGFIPSLVQDCNIFSFCYDNLGSKNANLLITTLTAMHNIIEKFEDRDITRQKIRECGRPTKLTNLCKHSNEEIRHLSTMLYEFVFDVKPVPIVEVSGEINQQEPEVIELDSEDDDTPVIETLQTRQRKRPAYTSNNGPLRRTKRFRVSPEQIDTDNTDSSSDDDDNSDGNHQYDDFDDHPINSSSAGAAPTESNRHDHSGRQSSVIDDTVATDDGPSRLNPKRELSAAPPHDFDIPATPASRRSSDLPSPNNEIVQNEIKPSSGGQSSNPSRLSSNHSHAVPESVSANDGNIRNNHVGRSTAVDSETAATADEIIRNGIYAPKPVITFVLPNQFTSPAAAANNDIIRDETIKYVCPAKFFIHQYCQNLGIQFSRDNYVEFISKIKFTQITSNSKPDKYFTANNESGFGCLSILLTGNEDGADKIRKEINKKFIDNLNTFDKEKIKEVTLSPVMLAEHLHTIATWLKCRIFLYCNGWKKYGSWDTENPMIPIFVLNKKENGYKIVLDLENNNV